MAKSKEIESMLKSSAGAMHDFIKYLPGELVGGLEWEIRARHEKDKRVSALWNSLTVLRKQTISVMDRIAEGDVSSPAFKKSAAALKRDSLRFHRQMLALAGKADCPPRTAKLLRACAPAIEMLAPVADVLVNGGIVLRPQRLRLKSMVARLRSYKNYEIGGQHMRGRVHFKVSGDPVVFADKAQLMRAMFNVYHDAITHSRGEPVVVEVSGAKNEVIFSTTNVGRRLARRVIAKIGNEPYSESPVWGVLHGYGKIAAKEAVEAHGGTFLPRNTRSGFKIALTIPKRPIKRVA